MKSIVKRVARRLKQRRTQQGLSQQALADKIRFTREYVARLETGLHDPPLTTLVKLAKALKVTVAELVK